ncbi:MAG: FAD-dependent thymidylate synthase [Marichromatium sp.]|nr:FAD-dependent thymidylate synthase [Marichromatium sp.]
MNVTLNVDLSCGTDLSIINAARRSFDTQHQEFAEADERLLRFLIREGHWLPFRHPQVSFSCEAPVAIARQLGKHQVGMDWSETSRRYKTTRLVLWTPEEWRMRPEGSIKQGTGPAAPPDLQAEASEILEQIHSTALAGYHRLLDLGIAPEQARLGLPQSMLVYWTWTGSLLAWLHLIRERSGPHAQQETREWVTRHIVPIIAERFPRTWAAIQDQEVKN